MHINIIKILLTSKYVTKYNSSSPNLIRLGIGKSKIIKLFYIRRKRSELRFCSMNVSECSIFNQIVFVTKNDNATLIFSAHVR